LKLRLEDKGEGWFWDRPSIEVDLLGQSWSHSRLYYLVRLEPPLDLRGSGSAAPEGPGGAATPQNSDVPEYHAAWVSSRWVGHEIGGGRDTEALVWLVSTEGTAEPPPGDSDYSARTNCRMLGRARHPRPGE